MYCSVSINRGFLRAGTDTLVPMGGYLRCKIVDATFGLRWYISDRFGYGSVKGRYARSGGWI